MIVTPDGYVLDQDHRVREDVTIGCSSCWLGTIEVTGYCRPPTWGVSTRGPALSGQAAADPRHPWVPIKVMCLCTFLRGRDRDCDRQKAGLDSSQRERSKLSTVAWSQSELSDAKGMKTKIWKQKQTK